MGRWYSYPPAPKRTVQVEIKIPTGKSCRDCKARIHVPGHDYCILYSQDLEYHRYRKPGDRNGWWHGLAYEKCDACYKGSKDYSLGAVENES